MDTEASHTPFIRINGEGPQREIAVRISSRNLADGEAFAREYLSDHPMRWEAGYTDEEVELMGAAFLLIAGSLPIFSYDLIRWTDETCMFDGAAAVREYGETHLDMSPKAPGHHGKTTELARAIGRSSAKQLAKAIPDYMDGDDIKEFIAALQGELVSLA